MINYIWTALLFIGIVTAAFNGRMKEVTEAVFASAKTSVEIAIGLIGVMALWLGLMKIAEEAGAVRLFSKAIHPILKRLFPEIPKGDKAMGSIAANIAANMLGLGNSATALGLKAMEDLQLLNPYKDRASNAMCMFLAINTASVTLVPATIIGIRAAAGSSNPAEIIFTTLFASAAATTTAIIAAKTFEKLSRHKEKEDK